MVEKGKEKKKRNFIKVCSRSKAGALIGDTVQCKLKLTMNANQANCWFLRRGETGVHGENLSVQSRVPTNSTHIWRQVWESNPGHIVGRRVLSPLRHPCTQDLFIACTRYPLSKFQSLVPFPKQSASKDGRTFKHSLQ